MVKHPAVRANLADVIDPKSAYPSRSHEAMVSGHGRHGHEVNSTVL